MPIYEYRCPQCGHEFEVLQNISEKPKKTCPRCQGRQVERLISATSFSLKGEGWFKDGYNKKTKKTEGAKTQEAKPPAAPPSQAEKKSLTKDS